MSRLAPILALLIATGAAAGCGSQADRPDASSTTPTVRLPVVPGRPGVGYFELPDTENRGALVSVTSPQIGRIEMHETMAHGTMSSMRPLTRVMPENGAFRFTPGGKHLMLYRIDPALAPGGQAVLMFHFENGATESLQATVQAAATPGS